LRTKLVSENDRSGNVLCQFWAERKRRLMIICPASLRKQWALELSEKFNLPSRVLDAKTYRDELRLGRAPLNEKSILIVFVQLCQRLA
jgi:SNF2 family DNA or RNA helicase